MSFFYAADFYMKYDLLQTVKKCQIGVLLGSLESTASGNSNGTSRRANGQVEGTQTRVKAANVPNWAKRSQESIWESGREVGDGTGRRVMECEMCTENGKEGIGWERQWAEIANPAKCRDSLQGAHLGVPSW
jgi:hypothetical protein